MVCYQVFENIDVLDKLRDKSHLKVKVKLCL